MPWSAATRGETYRLGDAVTVKLVEAAPVAGALRFELLSEGRPAAKPAAPRRTRERRTSTRPRGRTQEAQRKRKAR